MHNSGVSRRGIAELSLDVIARSEATKQSKIVLPARWIAVGCLKIETCTALSKHETVIASAAKQSMEHGSGLLRRFAPRNDDKGLR
jgi:hypothetical protein